MALKGGSGAPSLFAVVSLAVISHSAFTASRMTVSLAAIEMGAPTVVVGLLLSLYALLPMLLSVSLGRWIDRVGAGHGVSFGASFALSTLLIAAAFALLKWRWRFDGRTLLAPGARAPGSKTLDLLRTPELRRMYLAVVLISSAWDVLMFLVPVQGSKIGLSASEIGFVLGAFSAATFVVRVAMPLFINRVTEWQMIGLVLVVAALVYLVFPLVDSHYGLVALAFVLGLGLGVGQPAVMSLLHKVAPPGRVGEAVGLRMTMINGTQAVLPTLFGSLGSLMAGVFSGALTFAPLFWGVALMVGAGGVSALRHKGK